MAQLHAPTEPHDRGMLDVGEGNHVGWEVRGKPDGKPAAIVHGGPGSSLVGGRGRSFDRERCRIVLLDQRGCGRSLDIGAPLTTAWELARAWSDAALTVIADSGHTGSETMTLEIVRTLDRFAAA